MFVATAILALCPAVLQGQGGDLDQVDRLVAEGRFIEARTVLESWLESEWDGAPRADREQGIWLRALLTIDPSIAEVDYLRLVVEYPGGRFSDKALLRLAQGAGAKGDGAASQRYLQMLFRDYPESSEQARARAFLAASSEGTSSTARPASAGGSAPGSGTASANGPAPPEPTGPRPLSPDDSTLGRRSEVGSGPARADSSSALPVTVQIGAFSSEAAARALASDPRLTGFGVRLVRVAGSPLFRVRLGAFRDPEEASDLARDMMGRGIQPLVSFDRELESPVR